MFVKLFATSLVLPFTTRNWEAQLKLHFNK